MVEFGSFLVIMSFKIILWNVRGLGRSEKRFAIKRMVRELKPGIVFIQESKLESISGVLKK